MVEQESGESIGVEDEKIAEKEVQESKVQTKEKMNKGQKEEDKGKKEDIKEVMNEGKKAEDKGQEEDVEEISNAGEGWDKNAITSEEEARGGGRVEKEGCAAFIEEGRQTGTQANCTGDVIRQIGGHPTRGGQGNTRELAHLTNNAAGIPDGRTGTASNQTDRNLIGGLQNVAPRIPEEQTGTSHNQMQKNLIGQAVKSNGGGHRAGKIYINYL